ncbi:MAG TPA: HAMP domain-containing sensor histidine kinase [Propionicimonas sp.]|nr:HAMP domain-containing sensor histidine kinase [Propionicimonas sp.]HRA05978.1 HAMP domain-containing sensor histidine kinase [Propionicimonas sp.]
MTESSAWRWVRRLPGSLLRASGSDFREQLIAVTAMVGVPISWASAGINAYLGSPAWTVLLNFFAGLLILGLVWFGRSTGAYRLSYLIAVGTLFVVLFPGLFFASGGWRSGMPLWFGFALAFSAMILEGAALLVLLPLEAVVFTASLVLAYLVPETVVPLPSALSEFVDVTYSMLATGLALAIALRLFVRIHERNQDQLTARNAELARIDAARAEFLALVAHELNTPLAVIRTHIDEAELDLASADGGEPRAIADLSVIGSETDRLAHLVTQLLDLGRISEGRLHIDPRPVQLDAVIQQTLQAYRPLLTQNGNTLVVPHGSAAPTVLADRDRIIQVLVNLLSNASRHTQNGTISVSVGQVGPFAEIRVTDTGAGIASHVLSKLGQQPVRARQEGVRSARDTGLGVGLLISRQIAVAHGGDLVVESTLGEGTTVRFTLPLAA